MISVVIPTYRGEKSLPILVEQLHNVFTNEKLDYEIIIVNDASPDNTKQVLKELKCLYPKITVINLMRNYGQHNAILCGFKYAKGDIVITMDDDLQNPPKEIIKLIDGINRGFDLVIGAYDSKKHSSTRNIGGNIIDTIQRKIFGLPSNFQLTSFRAIRKNIIDSVNTMSVPYPYVTAMLLSQTTNYFNVPVKHEKRIYGKSNYNMKNIFTLAFNLIINYSSLPVYLVSVMTALSAIVSIGFVSYIFICILFIYKFNAGWASTMVAISFFNTLNLLSMSIFSLYLARTYQLTMKLKSSYVISEIY
jgi:glycosyltransferase involved in cell wall biosynthesis